MTTPTNTVQPAAHSSRTHALRPLSSFAGRVMTRLLSVLARLRVALLAVVVCIGASLLLVGDPPLLMVLVWWAAFITAVVGCGVGAGTLARLSGRRS
jgi:hypothetical protein